MNNPGVLTENFCKSNTDLSGTSVQDYFIMMFRKYNKINFNTDNLYGLPTYSKLFNQLSGLASVSSSSSYPAFTINSYSDGIYLRGWGTGNVINADQTTYKPSNPTPSNIGQYSQVRLLSHGHDTSGSGLTFNPDPPTTAGQHSHNYTQNPYNSAAAFEDNGAPNPIVPQSFQSSTPIVTSQPKIVDSSGNDFSSDNLLFYATIYDPRTNAYSQLDTVIKFFTVQAIGSPGVGNYNAPQGGANIDDVSPVSYYTNFFISFK